MGAQEQGKLFMAYADLEVAKKRAPTDKHIELAMEQLEIDMGVPGMCYTRKEILRGEHDRLQASFLAGLRCSHRWRCVAGVLRDRGVEPRWLVGLASWQISLCAYLLTQIR